MALLTLFPTDAGIRRLLAQPNDLQPRDPAIQYVPALEATPVFQVLFKDYCSHLRAACVDASEWWANTVAAQEARGMKTDEALEASFDKRLAGAASDPTIVWIVRSYWLRCEEHRLNAPLMRGVYPETVLLQWLIDAGETELVRLIACMPYWPIGLDENGNWC